MNRSIGFRKTTVDRFFQNLGKVYEEHGFTAVDVWNCDETGVTTVTKPPKVLAARGSRRVSSVTSDERGVLTTLIMACNAQGSFMPPYFVFKRKKQAPSLLNGAPPGSKMAVSDSGWSTEESFLEWFQGFISFTGASKTNKKLLICDNHFTHCNLKVWTLARDNGVVILTLPPHTSHQLQPLDVGFFGAFKSVYAREVSAWIQQHPGRKVTQYEVAGLVKKTFHLTAKMETAVNSFEKTKVFPYRPHAFHDSDFAHVATVMEVFEVEEEEED